MKTGSATAGKDNKAKITMDQVRAIALKKLPDMNTKNIDAAIKSVIGSAKSMGVDIV